MNLLVWIASVIMGNDARQGTLTDIVLGIVGALVGGIVMSMFGAPGTSVQINY